MVTARGISSFIGCDFCRKQPQTKILLCLLRRDYNAEDLSVEGCLLIGCAEFRACLFESLHCFASESDMGNFSTLESHCNSDLVTVLKETLCVLDLGFKVVYVDAVRKADLLNLNHLLALAGFLFLLLLLEAILFVVHDAANGRLRRGGDKNEVIAFILREIECLSGIHDSELLTVVADNSYLRCGDLFVNKLGFLSADT